MFHKLYTLLIQLSDDLAISDAIQDHSSFQEMFPVGNMKIEIIKMLLSLTFLLVVFGIGAWTFKKFVKSRGQGCSYSSIIKILDKRSLTPKTNIYLIQVANKILVIAENSEKTTLLSEFPPGTNINELIQNDEKKISSITSEFLNKAIQKLQKKSQIKQ
ncbi:FliO/MopB family protein [Chlamydia sp. 17-3921]|uniref:FliO/MopB family protein n=1 Tax=Chlamydia sp. 17-3921 TaxID=2675798 RepID=UPI001919D1D1|nr:FliO/MopB family protein [Chlamydia sp. 17-3921]